MLPAWAHRPLERADPLADRFHRVVQVLHPSYEFLTSYYISEHVFNWFVTHIFHCPHMFLFPCIHIYLSTRPCPLYHVEKTCSFRIRFYLISPMNEPAARERVRTNNRKEKRKKRQENRPWTQTSKDKKTENGAEEKRKRGKESLKERKPARKINQRGDVVNAARGSPHPRREDRTRLPKCRGLLTDDADIQRRRQRPPPHAGDDDAAVDSSSAANKN